MPDNTSTSSYGLAEPWKDTRAEGYVSYYTKARWDEWNSIVKEIDDLVKAKQITYKQALELYAKDKEALLEEKKMLEKKLLDIETKKADVLTRREEMRVRMEEARKLKEQALQTTKAQKMATRPASSVGGGKVGGGAGATGKDPYDELLDEIPSSTRGGFDARLADLSRGITKDNLDAKFAALQKHYDDGNIAADALTRDMASYTLYKNAIAALESAGMSSVDAEIAVNTAALRKPQINAGVGSARKRLADKEAAGDVKYQRSQFQGGYQTDYNVAKIEGGVADLTKTVDEYDAVKKAVEDRIKANTDTKLTKPVLEQVDVLTTARQQYMEKYGGIPTGVKLKFGDDSVAQYEDLMPYQITNALSQVGDMFGRYVQAEIEAAKQKVGRNLTTDEANAATEEGKRKARMVLFGGVYTPEEAAKVDAGKSPATSTNTSIPTDVRGWASVGVTRPETGNATADEASYQKAKEEWVKARDAKVKAETISPDVFDWNRPRTMKEIEADVAVARSSGILPVELPEGAPLPDTTKLQAPPRTPSEYESFFRNRVAPPSAPAPAQIDMRAILEEQRNRIESDDLRRRSFEGERRAPAMEVKPEGAIPASIAPPTEQSRTAVDYLLRGFKPELDRRTGQLIIPNITPQQYQDAVVGMTSGAQQAELFPESMTSLMPRTTSEGLAARPLAVGELKPTLNKLDRAALGIPDTVGTPVGKEVLGGDMGAAQRKKEALRKALEEAAERSKGRKEFLNEAGKVGKPEEGASLEMRDKKAKTEAVLAGALKAQENPKGAARDITKDNLGKYVASVYDENKIKGAGSKPISDLTQTIISEYAGDAEKQKKAVSLLTQLAYLDETKNKIKA